MFQVLCPQCGYRVGVGTFSDPGSCPNCELPLMLTCEMRALTSDELIAESERRKKSDGQARQRALL